VTDDSLPELRASDADRERSAELLRQAAGEGMLTVDELEERLGTVYETRTRRELERLTADISLDRAGATQHSRVPVRGQEGGQRWIVSVLSGHDRKGRWRLSERVTVLNFMGGSNLDLNDAEFSDAYTELTVYSIMGGADIRVPEGLNVEVSDFGLLGGNDVSIGDERPDPGGPTLKLNMISVLGGASVKRGRELSRAEKKRQKELRKSQR
jgi:hypothetical protein